MLQPPRINKVKKPTIADSQQDFALHILNINNLESAIENMIAEHRQNNQPIQPKLIVVGADSSTLQEFYVFFNNIKYKFPTFRKALDVVIKLMFVFNLEYPIVSKLVWLFIQEYFYEIPNSMIYPKVKNWVKKFSKNLE